MGWSLDFQSLRNLEQLNKFYLIAGKALYLANAFESKCGERTRSLRGDRSNMSDQVR